jgi:hypothetical protein
VEAHQRLADWAAVLNDLSAKSISSQLKSWLSLMVTLINTENAIDPNDPETPPAKIEQLLVQQNSGLYFACDLKSSFKLSAGQKAASNS